MASDPTFSTSDLRSAAQDSKRQATHKHKWHLGAAQNNEGRGLAAHPRPWRAPRNWPPKRNVTDRGYAPAVPHKKIALKQNMLEGAAEAAVSDDSYSSNSDHDEALSSSPPDAEIMYSFDSARGPSRGSEVLNVALAKAVEKFEERETAKLVKNEYDVIDSEGESVGLSPVKKGKGKAKVQAMPAVEEDEDYEFV